MSANGERRRRRAPLDGRGRGAPAGAGRHGLRGLAGAPAERPEPRRRRRRRGRGAAGRRRRALRPVRHHDPRGHRHLLHLVERRIVVRVRGCWACAPARASTGPAGNRTLWLPDLDVPDDLWASFQIPIGLAFFMDSTVTGVRRRDVPEPGRRDRERAALRVVEPDARAQPGARRARARHRGPDRQPPRRPAGVRDRADRPLLRADRHDQGALGGDLGRRRRARRRWRRSSRSCAHEAVARVSVATTGPTHARRRPRRRARPGVRGASARAPVKYAAAPMLALDLHVTRAERPPGVHDRADDPADDRAGPPALRRRHARAADRAVRRARALGGHDAQPRVVAARRARARVHRLDDGRGADRRATTTSRSPPPSTCTRCPTARRRWRCTSTA